MCFKVRSFLLAVLLFLPLVFLLGCTSSMEQDFEEGRIYAVNNTRGPIYTGYSLDIRGVWVVFEGGHYDIPFNMTTEGDPTGAGAVELTESPLSGGMIVEVTCYVRYRDTTGEEKVTVTVDGNMTIDIYMEDWDIRHSIITTRVVPGRWDGIHFY